MTADTRDTVSLVSAMSQTLQTLETLQTQVSISSVCRRLAVSTIRGRVAPSNQSMPYKNKYWRETKFGESPRNRQV